MKGFFIGFFILVTLICLTCFATADIPDLVGNWSGSYEDYNADTGFSEAGEGNFFMNITEQHDRIFIGFTLYLKKDGTEVKHDIAGVISADGTELSLAEKDNGYSSGKINGPDKFELIYLDDKDPISVAADKFSRIT